MPAASQAIIYWFWQVSTSFDKLRHVFFFSFFPDFTTQYTRNLNGIRCHWSNEPLSTSWLLPIFLFKPQETQTIERRVAAAWSVVIPAGFKSSHPRFSLRYSSFVLVSCVSRCAVARSQPSWTWMKPRARSYKKSREHYVPTRLWPFSANWFPNINKVARDGQKPLEQPPSPKCSH